MKKTMWIIPVLLILGIQMVLGAGTCTYYSYTSDTGSSDFFGVNTAGDNVTTFTENQTFAGWSFFTPRLNLTRQVNETFTVPAINENNTINWVMNSNFSASLVIYNGSNTINAGNYTLVNPTASGWAINWLTANYQGKTVVVSFNKTFVKNVDDLVAGPGTIYSGATIGNFLTVNNPTYGSNLTFRFNATGQGIYLNNSNWAVGWLVTNRTCLATLADQATYTGVVGAQTATFAAFALLGVMLIVMAAFGIMTIVKGGDIDYIALGGVIIGGAIILMIGAVVIYFVRAAITG